MQITNGSVTFERTRKTADYEGKKASVTLSFVIPDGEDPEGACATVGALAMSRALVMVGEAHVPAEAQVAAVPPTSGRGKNKPAAPVIVPSLPPDGMPVNGAQSPSPTGLLVTNDASPSDVAPGPFGGATAEPVSSVVLPTGPLPNPVSVTDPKLTDQALSEACGAKVNSATDPERRQTLVTALKDLRAQFTGNPALTVAAIPMEQRGTFLAQLQAL